MHVRPNFQPAPILGLWCTPHLACAHYRCVAPLSVLDAGWCSIADVTEAQLDAAHTVVLTRPAGRRDDIAAMIADLKRRGLRVLVDYDDDYFAPWPMPPAGGETAISMLRDGCKQAMHDADGVLVPNAHLAHVLSGHTDTPIIVNRHAIRADWWPKAAERTGQTIVGLFGGSSHIEDWKIAVPALVAAREAGALVYTVGFHPAYLDGVSSHATKWVPHAQYMGIVNAVDILIAPLKDTVFNRSKSEGRVLEAAMSGCAVAASKVVYGDALSLATLPSARNADELTEILLHYVTSIGARLDAGAALRSHVIPRYDARFRVNELHHIYTMEVPTWPQSEVLTASSK